MMVQLVLEDDAVVSSRDGTRVGLVVGEVLGLSVGLSVGEVDGEDDGLTVGGGGVLGGRPGWTFGESMVELNMARPLCPANRSALEGAGSHPG